MPDMNGAQALIRPLVDCGVDTCFANPGTSEMYFVAAGVEKHIVQRVVSSPMDPIYDQARELVNLLVFDTEDNLDRFEFSPAPGLRVQTERAIVVTRARTAGE